MGYTLLPSPMAFCRIIYSKTIRWQTASEASRFRRGFGFGFAGGKQTRNYRSRLRQVRSALELRTFAKYQKI
jgi:hypothetical protein